MGPTSLPPFSRTDLLLRSLPLRVLFGTQKTDSGSNRPSKSRPKSFGEPGHLFSRHQSSSSDFQQVPSLKVLFPPPTHPNHFSPGVGERQGCGFGCGFLASIKRSQAGNRSYPRRRSAAIVKEGSRLARTVVLRASRRENEPADSDWRSPLVQGFDSTDTSLPLPLTTRHLVDGKRLETIQENTPKLRPRTRSLWVTLPTFGGE